MANEPQGMDLAPAIVGRSSGSNRLCRVIRAPGASATQYLGASERSNILGTAQFTAPEHFLGEAGTERSDLFSLGVITYQMLSGRLLYGTPVASARARLAQRLFARSGLR